jgi:hypothetical protein
MSNVRATVVVPRVPWLRTFAGERSAAPLGAGLGLDVGGEAEGVPVGPGLGVGGLASSTTTPGMIESRQPTSIRLGSYLGDSGSRLGYAPRFHQAIDRGVVWNDVAIDESVSPAWTT